MLRVLSTFKVPCFFVLKHILFCIIIHVYHVQVHVQRFETKCHIETYYIIDNYHIISFSKQKYNETYEIKSINSKVNIIKIP